MRRTKKNRFHEIALASYKNTRCVSEKEFREDLSRIVHLQKLLKRYQMKNELSERLILNHLIVLANVFHLNALIELLFFKIDQEHWKSLRTFLLFLNYISDDFLPDEGIDLTVAKKLSSI